MTNTNKKYKQINQLIDKISSNHKNFDKKFNIELKNRILQILSQEITDNYNKELNFNKFKISNHEVNIKLSYIFNTVLKFFIKYIIFSTICILNLLKKNKYKNPNIIEIDKIENYKSFKNIIEFISENKKIFKNYGYFIINEKGISFKKNKKYTCINKNLFFFIINDILNIKQKLILLKKLSQIFCKSFSYILNSDLRIFLLDDLLKLEIIKISNINNFFTTSNRVRNTPLWMSYNINKKFKTNMLWLGETALNLPRLFKNQDGKKYQKNILPFYKFINVDNHFVWNHQFQNFLKKNLLIKKKIINNKKPIIFCRLKKFKTQKKNIFIFDNNPKFKGFNGNLENYASEEVIIKFLRDICHQFNSLKKYKYNLIIKKKKIGFNNWFESKNYIDNFDYLKFKYKKIKIIDDNYNTVKYLNSSILCICFPFSSSARLSKFFNIKTVFYDPTSKLKNIYYDKKISLISSKKELRSIFNKI